MFGKSKKSTPAIHQCYATDGTPYQATGAPNVWVGDDESVFAPPRYNNKATAILSGKAYFADLIKSIEGAEKEVLITGWAVAWDALLAPTTTQIPLRPQPRPLRLYDLIYETLVSKPNVKFYIMPWNDRDPIQTYDDQTKTVLESINDRLGLSGDDRRVYVVLSKSFAAVNTSYYSHHQKFVVVDRKIGYMGGMDLYYGRYDTAAYSLKADKDGRQALNRYNPCIAWMKPLDEKTDNMVDPDLMTGLYDRLVHRDDMLARIASGGWQMPYKDNGLLDTALDISAFDSNTPRLETPNADYQPRMPWQDVHCRLEGPIVYDMVRNFVMRWNLASNGKPHLDLPTFPLLNIPFGMEYPPGMEYPAAGNADIQFLRSTPAAQRIAEYNANKEAFVKKPVCPEFGIHESMTDLINNAAHFIYMESQFFISDFGEVRRYPLNKLSPVGSHIKSSPQGIGRISTWFLRRWDDEDHPEKNLPQNQICRALVERIRRAILDTSNPYFYVYITLPVHPEGDLQGYQTIAQVYLTMQTLVHGSHSLFNGIRRAFKEREYILQKQQAEKAGDTAAAATAEEHATSVRLDPRDNTYKSVSIEACYQYVTLLNLRTWDKFTVIPKPKDDTEKTADGSAGADTARRQPGRVARRRHRTAHRRLEHPARRRRLPDFQQRPPAGRLHPDGRPRSRAVRPGICHQSQSCR